MLLSENVPHNLPSRRASLFNLVRKCTPFAPPSREPDTVLENLERLAMLSPHLLADLGFSIDECESTATAICWRRDDMLVFVAVAESRSFAMRETVRKMRQA